MSRGPRSSQDRLLNLLYKKTVPEIRPRIPAVKRVLYEQPIAPPGKSALDSLMKYLWWQDPMENAMEEITKKIPKIPKSNVIELRCKNAFVGKDDLINMFPVAEERQYNLEGDLEKGLEFHVIKARNPVSLLFLGSYYLVFPNYNQACVYYLETQGKHINGLEMDLNFLKITENHLKRMSSPFLHHPTPIENFDYLSDNYGRVSISDLFQKSPNQLFNLKEILGIPRKKSKFVSQNVDPMYNILNEYLGKQFRNRLVIVRNLPLGVTGPGLESLLWDYEFENEDNPQASITNLFSNASTHITLALMKFKDHKNAKRFVRNYHGRKWEKVTNRKEKSLYEPILCEIAD